MPPLKRLRRRLATCALAVDHNNSFADRDAEFLESPTILTGSIQLGNLGQQCKLVGEVGRSYKALMVLLRDGNIESAERSRKIRTTRMLRLN